MRLSPTGRRQATELAARLGGAPLAAVYSSPRERCVETAEHLAAALGLSVKTCEAVDELDYGAWTGRSFDELDGSPEWKLWNSARGSMRIPGGETILEVQARAVAGLEALRTAHPEREIAVVSHGDVIRAALAYWLGSPLDLMLRIEVAPASVSTARLADRGPAVLRVNWTAEAG